MTPDNRNTSSFVEFPHRNWQIPEIKITQLNEETRGITLDFIHQINKFKQELDTDPLTGAKSPYAFKRELPRLLENSEEGDLALIMIDLDDFKTINDTAGHLAGDEALKEFVDSCHVSLRKGETLYRTGGDEFVILVDKSISGDRRKESETKVQVERRLEEKRKADLEIGLAKRIFNIFAEADKKFQLKSGNTSVDVSVSGSFGVAYNKPGDTESEIMERADEALYKLKEHKNGNNSKINNYPGFY